MWPKKIVLVFIAVWATTPSTALIHLTPHDKEVVYTWKSIVQAGTYLPTPYASQFTLDAKIHLQSDPNATTIKITGLTYKLYNGILDNVQEHEAHSVPVPVKELEEPFKVVYDTNGFAVGIVTKEKEEEWSRNIKKAIATTLQMDQSVTKETHQHYPRSFVTKEHSIYGHYDVDYTVTHHENGDIEVHKLHDMHHTHHLYQHMVSNNEHLPCDLGHENALMHDSTKEYVIGQQNGHHVIKEIRAGGSVVYQPLKGKSDSQFVFVNQTFHFEEIVPKTEFHVTEGHFEEGLTYHFSDSRDITNGRHVVNYEKLIPKVQEMLGDIHHYLQEDHLQKEDPKSQRGQLINRVQRLLQFFTQAKLEELHKQLTGHALNIFHHILPLVGTEASALFIKNLVIHKSVSEEVSNEMLRHFPEYMAEATLDFLTQMEEIHHKDDLPWAVKKTAILAFGSLVHQCHKHIKNQEPLEKYVLEYVNKLKTSQDFKIQQVYAFGLSNMKLPIIASHVLPGVRGEWSSNPHFRVICLSAVGPAILSDPNPNAIIESLWPIFTNTEENTEMRIEAFYYFMESRPSESRVMNMYGYLLQEPNEEVYRWVYSYMHEMMESDEPCDQEFKVRMTHLVEFLPAPTHGISFAHSHEYMDQNFGFSSRVASYFINGNHSLTFGWDTSSQQFNIRHQEYHFYFKVAGVHYHDNPLGILLDTKQHINKKDLHIEAIITRRGQTISTYFVTENNLHELDEILNLFTQESYSLTKELLHVSYDRYNNIDIPTDLGIPVVWQYLVPVVHHNNVTIKKEMVNKVINLQVENRYVSWVHYRHGLILYNPIVDVHQGINRYNSYDAVWPLRFDISINTQQRSVQMSWKKHTNPTLDIGGIRSHVKQMVFTKNDYSTNALAQSSPKCKQFVIVGPGNNFKNDYLISHGDDLTSGHQWEVSVYDSSNYVSNGSFNHLMHQFTQSHTKSTETPLGHFLTSYYHWHQYLFLLPEPGSHGFIVKVVPSTHHSVSDIDLSMRLHSEPATEDSYLYTPKIKWSTRCTYSVKNQEKSLKTWDVNAIVDMNSGHSVNSLKMHITRIIPGQKDYKICVDGTKKWTQKGVEGHLNIAMSQTADGKCVKDDTVVDVTVTGHQSQEQIDGRHKYHSCENISPYSMPHKHSLQCLIDHTTVRHYVYEVKTTNVPSEFRKVCSHWWDIIKGYYMSYYDFEDEHNENIGEHNLKVDVIYPMQEEEVDVKVTTPQHVYSLTGVPTQYWKWFGFIPDSTEYSRKFQILHQIGWVDHCVVHPDHYHLNQNDWHEKVPNEWTLYTGNAPENPQKGVYVKQVANGELALKIVNFDHTFEIVPHGANHQITVDGTVVPMDQYHHEDWVYWHVFTQDFHHPVAAVFHNIHVEYQHHQIIVVVPKIEQEIYGRCYSHH